MLVRPPGRALASLMQAKNKSLGSTGTVAMVNTNERVTTGVFGLSLTAVFVGLLLLNALSF